MDSETKETSEVEYEPNNTVSNGSRWTGKLNSTKEYVWNSSKREFIGRTWSSWAKIGLFYFIFYSCLAAFFGIMLGVFFLTLDNNVPTQTGMYSLIKQNPGMGFRPMVDIERTLIQFKQGEPESYQPLVDNIESFLDDYYRQEGDNVINCTSNKALNKESDEVCDISDIMKDSLPCSKAVNYGYEEGMPCVLLKINKVFNWKPKPFQLDDFENELDAHAQKAKEVLNVAGYDPDYISVTCEGETDADKDNIGKMSFYPAKGFPFRFYPYLNQDQYRQPIVFVKFEGIVPGRLVQVWCKAWARNIKHHANDRAGSLRFEIMID